MAKKAEEKERERDEWRGKLEREVMEKGGRGKRQGKEGKREVRRGGELLLVRVDVNVHHMQSLVESEHYTHLCQLTVYLKMQEHLTLASVQGSVFGKVLDYSTSNVVK